MTALYIVGWVAGGCATVAFGNWLNDTHAVVLRPRDWFVLMLIWPIILMVLVLF